VCRLEGYEVCFRRGRYARRYDCVVLVTSVAGGLSPAACRPVVSADTQMTSSTVVSDCWRVARLVGVGECREAVTAEWQSCTAPCARTVAVEHVAHVAVEARQKHGGRRGESGHVTPVGRRQTTHVHVAVIHRVAECPAPT